MKSLLSVAVAAACLLSAAPASAIDFAQIVACERAVKQMPMNERPNRLGHVYGNNVRRIEHQRVFINAGRYEKPMLRYLYIPQLP